MLEKSRFSNAYLIFIKPFSFFIHTISPMKKIALFFFFIVYSLIKVRKSRFSTGYEGMIGEMGEVITSIDGVVKIFVQGEYWNAESDEIVNRGEKVEIVKVISNMKLKVKKHKEE